MPKPNRPRLSDPTWVMPVHRPLLPQPPNLTYPMAGHPTLNSKEKVHLTKCGSCRLLVGWNLLING